MRHIFCLLLTIGISTSLWAKDPEYVQHKLNINFKISESSLEVQDTIILPKSKKVFYLHEQLKLKPNKRIKYLTDKNYGFFTLKKYEIIGSAKLNISYRGQIAHSIQNRTAEYARSMKETPGIISEKGIFLAGSSYWLPYFPDSLITFEMNIQKPKEWQFMSQGSMTEEKNSIRFVEHNPQEEVYIIGGPYHHYSQVQDKWQAGVLLRSADEALANRYLSVTGQYLTMFSELLGDYPYSKFYMVENFWDTGYGMPSFTLLGPRVIRFPFILHSSYPHEILHNWWGNGVYTNYAAGNWAEGLTSYLADHLIQEQRNRGRLYRRTTLQKYADYVSEKQDFPLSQFKSRHSSASQAVGYGKTLMFFHMLRNRLGDKAFKQALRSFYKNYRFKVAAFKDIQGIVNKVTRQDHTGFFKQWVEIKGAPKIELKQAKQRRVKKAHLIDIQLAQVQKHHLYQLDIPLRIVFENGGQQSINFSLNKTMENKRFKFDQPVAMIEVDPEFEVFRKVHTEEIPPALSKLFGAKEIAMILPAKAQKDKLAAYKMLVNAWSHNQEGKFRVYLDSELQKLPESSAVWILGWKNKFRPRLNRAIEKYSVKISDNAYAIDGKKLGAEKSIIFTARHPNKKDGVVAMLLADNLRAVAGLARKLPHYGKYSYLAFKGTEPKNILKGQWQTINSPMQKKFLKVANIPDYPMEVALAQPPSAYSLARIKKHIEKMAGPKSQGRELGSKELEQIANYIAAEFKQMGLRAGGKNGYFQTWRENIPVKGKIQLSNVIAYLPGVNPKFSKESVVISAHYDHLGRGWPDVHKGDKGKIHYGANDNASGVASMLEFARSIAKSWKPQRSIVFVAFTGEEAGLVGSRHLVENELQFPIKKVIAMINLDSIGRLDSNKLQVFGSNSAREWVHIMRGVSFVTGIKIESIEKDFGSGDQHSFLAKGVPAIMLFGGLNADYHRPSDTIEKLDYAGMVKVIKVLKESVEHLANRDTGLTVQIAGFKSVVPKNVGGGRKVSLGTIPDFSFSGRGVKITGVRPNSPAQKAGLKSGDIIIQLNENKINDLREFALYLRNLSAGTNLKIFFRRNNKTISVKTQVVSR